MQFQIEKLILWPKNQKYSYKDIELNTIHLMLLPETPGLENQLLYL